jgi:hypothetical protein
MYSAFILGSVVEIMMYHRVNLPAKLDYACGVLAFSVEAFLFANHLHSREALDIHLHVLLVYAVYGCVFFCILEYINPHNVMFAYGRILFTMLQGTWFFEVGFVLYPPTDDPAFQWDKNDHNQIMTITMSYAWHVMLIIIGLLIQLAIIKKLYASSKFFAEQWDELVVIDEAANDCAVTRVLDSTETTKFLSLNTDDEDSADEKVHFDTTRLIKTEELNENDKKDNIKMNNFKKSNGSSASSSTSGHCSNNASCCSGDSKAKFHANV